MLHSFADDAGCVNGAKIKPGGSKIERPGF
jgi:hypothetical protein